MKLKLIVAICNNMGIGYNNTIPWYIKKDLIHFSNKTTGIYGKYIKDKQKYGNNNDYKNDDKNKDKYDHKVMEKYKYNIIKKNAVVMGKNTWMSLPKNPAPLPYRDNIIISNTIHTSQIKSEYNLLNMDNVKLSSAIKTFYDLMYYQQLHEECNLKNSSDFIMYFSSIPSMIDYCMTSDKIWDTIFDSDVNTVSSDIEIEMSEICEVQEVREINQKSFLENNNETMEIIDNVSDTSIYDEVWIIGGAQLYNSFINENNKKDSNMLIHEFCITYIDKYYECDTFFPKIENMNLYYISYFLKCENIDLNIGKEIPVYYITFTRFDVKNNVEVEKRIVEIKYNENDNNPNESIQIQYYYYYVKSNMELECGNTFITNQNARSFLWCITEL
jgi:dihydrofolate reductase